MGINQTQNWDKLLKETDTNQAGFTKFLVNYLEF